MISLRILLLFLLLHHNIQSTGPKKESDSCTICLTDLDSDDSVKKLRCSHQFHQPCINNWYKTSGKLSCPLCRSDNADIVKSFKDAIDSGNEIQLIAILAEHPSLAHYIFDTETQATALHRAAQRGFPNIVRWLVFYGASPNARNIFDETPLHFAAEAGHYATVYELCNSNGSVNAQDQEGNTPLHRAAKNGWSKTSYALLRRGAKRNTKTFFTKYTPLHCVVLKCKDPNKQWRTAKVLLDNHADLLAGDKDNKTPLQHAVLHGEMPLVTLLCKYRFAGI